jgi:flagellar FliJ protein
MRRFQFRLESLLRYREYLEKQVKQEVADVRAEILQCEERIDRYETDQAETTQELEQEVATGIDSKRYKHYTDFIESIEAGIQAENMLLDELQMRLSEKQRQLAQRSVDKKVLEKLKDRRREEYHQEAIRRFQKESDDMIVTRNARSAT